MAGVAKREKKSDTSGRQRRHALCLSALQLCSPAPAPDPLCLFLPSFRRCVISGLQLGYTIWHYLGLPPCCALMQKHKTNYERYAKSTRCAQAAPQLGVGASFWEVRGTFDLMKMLALQVKCYEAQPSGGGGRGTHTLIHTHT